MAGGRIEQALARLDAAMTRAEAAAATLEGVARRSHEFAGIEERHSKLKHSVAQSLRQLDDILAESPQ